MFSCKRVSWILLCGLIFLPLNQVTALASGHGEEAPGEGHGGAGGHEASGPKKSALAPYSKSGTKGCVKPAKRETEDMACGSSSYASYAKEVDAYNECMRPISHKQPKNIEPCKQIKFKKHPEGHAAAEDDDAPLKHPNGKHPLDPPLDHNEAPSL